MQNRTARAAGAVLLTSILLTSAIQSAHADDELSLDWSGKIQSDLRFRIQPVSVGEFYSKQELPAGVERNWNMLTLKLDAKYGRFKGVADIDIVWSGYPEQMTSITDLSRVQKADPFHVDARGLYVEANGIFFDDLDLKIGQQVVAWGVGDQFNPTNNLNADDLRDPLLFGKQAPNFMVKADYWLSEDWTISGVLVPIFKPALLPLSGSLAVAQLDRIPFTDNKLGRRVISEQDGARILFGYPTVVGSVTPNLPDASFENMQVAYRIAGTIAEQDVALSYYNGRTDFPQPRANHTHQVKGERCDPDDASKCIKGTLVTDVTLEYPRMHVYGLNMTGEVNPLKWISEDINGIGYRLEAALVVPERQTIKLTNDLLDLDPTLQQPAGEYDYNGFAEGIGREPEVVPSTAFLKWVVGLDYTFGEHVYVNAMWVHGLADEYGAGDFIHEGYAVRQSGVLTDPLSKQKLYSCATGKDGERCAREIFRPRLGDYVVLGADFKFLNQAALFRLFTILDVTPLEEDTYDLEQRKRVTRKISPLSSEGFSMVIFPELDYNFGNGLELGVGALLELGKPYTKFGDAATGGSVVWTRGRFSF